MTLIVHFQTSQEKRCTKGLLSFHRVADDEVIRVYDDAGNVIETHEHAGGFKSCKNLSHSPNVEPDGTQPEFGKIDRRRRLSYWPLLIPTL